MTYVHPPYGLRSMRGPCCRVMGDTQQRDELAQMVATLQPGEVADLMIRVDSEAQRRGMLIGVGLGVAGAIVLKKLFF